MRTAIDRRAQREPIEGLLPSAGDGALSWAADDPPLHLDPERVFRCGLRQLPQWQE